MHSPPTIFVLGAPGTGAQALGAALTARTPPGSAHIVCPRSVGAIPAALAPDARLILLMGLDQPCPADERTAQEAADAELRTELSHAGMTYRVVYGQGEQRTTNALIAIASVAKNADRESARDLLDPSHSARNRRQDRLRAWNCEKCSDPQCEHRLFTALVGRDD